MKIIRPITITDAVLTSSNVTEADYPAYNAATAYAPLTYVMLASVHKNYQSLKAVQNVVTMTIAAPCLVTWVGHGLATSTPVSFTTTVALPTGIVASTEYYVLYVSADTFYITATIGGSAITTTGSQSGTHTITVRPGLTTTPSFWLDVGATNRWKMFDGSVQSQTTNTTSIVNVYTISGRADSVALLNISAASVTVTMTDAVDGIVYSKTTVLTSSSGILDWYAYFFEPIVRTTDITFVDLPPYANAVITVTLTDSGSTVMCGATVIGTQKDMGSLSTGAKLSSQSYSTKVRDSFGNYTVNAKGFSKKSNFTVMIDVGYIDEMYRVLTAYKDIPIVYIGTEKEGYGSTIIYGFYKDFTIDITYSTKALCSMEIEGLT